MFTKRARVAVPTERSLAFCYPDIAAQLRDKSLDPFQVFATSHSKCEWVCADQPTCRECGTEHVWEATVSNRTRGSGCPWCSNKGGTVLCKCKSLGYKYPDLVSQLANKSLDPFKISACSGVKYEWVCVDQPTCRECGTEHKWETTVSARVHGGGCPWCSSNRHVLCKCKSLGYKCPDVASQLADKSLDPFKISACSGAKYEWVCVDQPTCRECGTEHKWEADVASRTRGSGCPWCSHAGAVLCKCKSLGYKHPDLASQLVNKNLDPFKISAYSYVKCEWVCADQPTCRECGTEHKWEAIVHNRSSGGNGCPWCSSAGSVLCKCKSLGYKRPDIASQLADKSLDPFEISVSSASRYTWVCTDQPTCRECGTEHKWETTVSTRVHGGGCPWCSNAGSVLCKCKSLGYKCPDVASQLADKSLDPFEISVSSASRYTWVCTDQPTCRECGTEHKWETTVSTRVHGGGCPWCSSNRHVLCKCKSLGYKWPDVAKQLADKSVNPFTISAHSNTKYEWECLVGHGPWTASVDSRTSRGTGCPTCRVNKAEKLLAECLESSLRVECFAKVRLECFDPVTQRVRQLIPDAIATLTCGKKAEIELDGPQHFEVVYWYSPQGTDLKDQLCRDWAKNQYACEQNWSLLRIAYTEYTKIPELVNNFITAVETADSRVVVFSNPELYTNQANAMKELGLE